MSRLVEYLNAALMAQGLAALVAGELATALSTGGKASLAVPGGTTPAGFLRALSVANIDWAGVSVLLTDERDVPESSTRSNTRLLRETLLQNKAATARLVPLRSDPPDAAKISKGIRAALPLDICVLGMGADGHIASLFPKADRLNAALAADCPDVILPLRAEAASEPRLTLTAPVIEGARHIHLLIAGPAKMAALLRAEQPGPVASAPVRLILTRPDLTIHYSKEVPA